MSKKDYTVGKGKPPKEYQFKEGQSGNPKGRPVRKFWKPPEDQGFDIARAIHNSISTLITVKRGNRRIKMTKGQLIIEQLINMALEKDPLAIKQLIPILGRLPEAQPEVIVMQVVGVDPKKKKEGEEN